MANNSKTVQLTPTQARWINSTIEQGERCAFDFGINCPFKDPEFLDLMLIPGSNVLILTTLSIHVSSERPSLWNSNTKSLAWHWLASANMSF